jgi:predicted Zn-dependent protease
MKPLCFVLLASLALATTGCYTVPETGRKALVLPFFNDVENGAQAFQEVKAKEKISQDPAANARVQRVGTRIAEAVGSNLPGAQWEFVVFDSPQTVNAFALPGGKVAVYTGLLNLAASDDELAFVMGHEIAHVTSRHGAEQMSKQMILSGVGAAADYGTKDSKYHDALLALYGAGTTAGTLFFSRQDETEADFVGLRYSAKAGYDPHAAIAFWQKMTQQNKASKTPEFLSTHPADERRIAALEKELPQVIPLYDAAKTRYQ